MSPLILDNFPYNEYINQSCSFSYSVMKISAFDLNLYTLLIIKVKITYQIDSTVILNFQLSKTGRLFFSGAEIS